jgi:hypothetical protein
MLLKVLERNALKERRSTPLSQSYIMRSRCSTHALVLAQCLLSLTTFQVFSQPVETGYVVKSTAYCHTEKAGGGFNQQLDAIFAKVARGFLHCFSAQNPAQDSTILFTTRQRQRPLIYGRPRYRTI